jgi:organic hydroperoxide reductase OsmC/OhrA
VVVAPGAGERVRALLIRAHHDCFIANSIKAEIILEPEIRHADGSEELRIV